MFSNVMKKMLALALSLTFVLALIPTTASAAGGTVAEMFSGALTISSDYDADATDDSAAVTVAEESVTLRVWWIKNSCGHTHNNATVTLKNTSGDGLTVKFRFDLKGFYREVKIDDFTFTTNGVAEVTLGIDEEIDITLYNDGSNDNEDDVEDGEAVLTLDNFVLTPFHICTGTLVEGKDADCENDGWADYYECSCEKLYADEACTDEITDLDAWKEGDGKIETLGHDYGTLVDEVPAIHTDSELKAGMEAHYHCGRCGTYFTEEKVATTQTELIIPTPSHNYDDQYGYIGDDGHADFCACGAQDAVKPHTPDIPAPTETQDQKCSACGHLIAPKLGHIHANHLTKVEATPASCTDDGNIEYYECSCGAYFEDDSASVAIADIDAWKAGDGKIAAEGHKYTEQIKDAAHLKSEATKCTEYDIYWYGCSVCDANAKNDPNATDKFWTSTDAGDHEFDTTQWGYKDKAAGHAHKCNYCTEHDAVQPHTPDREAATETEDKICTACQIVLETATGHICKNHLTKVPANGASCTQDGNIEYYECSCGKYYTDSTAAVEITDKESVKIPAGHKYGELVQEEPAVHTAAEQKDGMKAHYFCDECDTYFTAEKVATTKDALVIANAHSHGTEWKSDKDNHWNECVCGDKANSAAHEDENKDGKCDVCEYNVGTPSDNPQTGDDSNMILWISLLMLSALGVLAATVLGKKRYSVK